MKDFMRAAIRSGRQGIRLNHGGPFGACLVKKGKIIAIAHNTVLRDHDPTCHAEINAIRRACHILKTHDLTGCVLYTNAEPCPMCLGAIYWARIRHIVIGVTSEVMDDFGFNDAIIRADMKRPFQKRKVKMQQGIMRKESKSIFMEWKKLKRSLY